MDNEKKYTSAKTTFKEKRNKGKTTLIQNNTYNTFEPPKEKKHINISGTAKLISIILAITTLIFIIGGKTYNITVKNGEVERTGSKPPTLMQIIQYAQTAPDVGLQNAIKDIVTTINGTNETIQKYRQTTINPSNALSFMMSAFIVLFNIFWIPILFIIQIVTFIGWAIGAIFVL